VKKSSKHSRREKGQKAPAPERISEIQQALAKDGSFAGTPSGKWDDSTVEAMKKFQSGHGLNPSGRLDAPTLQKLGLGSQTAGVAAPMPPIASSLAIKPAQSAQRQ
jgi:peptidoglycan hydrolase-like protein with peptidoglycan-binding domain